MPTRPGRFAGTLLTSAMSAVSASAVAAAGAAADDSAAPKSDEREVIYVTAQKREQAVKDVAASLTVLGRTLLDDTGATTLNDLVALTPGLSGVNPSNELVALTIRGAGTNDFGVGSDPAIGLFVDDVYLGRSENTATTFVDLERAEVLRGPQGALFGRATPAGAVSLVTRRPHDDVEITASGALGTEGRREFTGVYNAPLTDTILFRGVAYYDHDDGYVDNRTNGAELLGEETFNLRASLLFTNIAGGELQLTAWGERFRGDPWVYDNLDVADFERTGLVSQVESDLDPREDRNLFGGIARFERPVGGMDFVSITSTLGHETDYLEDFDGTSMFLFNFGAYEDQYLATQEFRLLSPADGPLTWFAGIIGYREEVGTMIAQSYDDGDLCGFFELDDPAVCATYAGTVTDTLIFADGDNIGASVYGEVSYAFNHRLTGTLGLRQTWDDKEFVVNSPVPGGNLDPDDVAYITHTDGLDSKRDRSFTSTQARLGLTFDISDDLSAFAAVANGEKPGGFSTFDPFIPGFGAEKVVNYEAGLRGSSFDDRLGWNLTAYRYDATDLQVGVMSGGRLEIQNAGEARGYGLEAEAAVRPVDFASLRLAGAWTDARYETFIDSGDDFSGNRMSQTPELAFNALLDLRRDLGGEFEGFWQTQADYTTRQYFSPANLNFESQGPLTLVDMRVGVEAPDGRWRLAAFVENLTDEEYIGLAGEASFLNFGAFQAIPGRPRVGGVRLDWTLR